uniref:Ubiquitin carboxyl-terminal hydrolase n=1 Tax=Phallusia mammillata TaxID=59560 RepID=A0A6F9DWT3_9ASCI|nr:ubiquitin carboxyl-terminal hydrolase isozyme L3-like [Phallusia mammillata]
MAETRWMPLESNPEVMNTFIHKLGVSKKWQFTDVYGLDPELLCMVPQPCCALILLFPVSEKYGDYCKTEGERLANEGQKVSPEVFFMKQTIRNACGTIGVIHAVANNKNRIGIKDASVFSKFLTDVKTMSPEEIGKRLENDSSIRDVHKTCAEEGQTEAIQAEENVDLHFVALVHVDNSLYELDGNKPFPINHGSTSNDTFLEDAAKVCREFMSRDEKELRFTIVALSEM